MFHLSRNFPYLEFLSRDLTRHFNSFIFRVREIICHAILSSYLPFSISLPSFSLVFGFFSCLETSRFSVFSPVLLLIFGLIQFVVHLTFG